MGDMHGMTVTSSATLWTISMTTEGQGTSVEQDVDMCGDNMQKSEDDDSCGKIEAVRFFTICTLLLALAAAAVLLVAFSPTCREKPDLRSKLCLAGGCLTSLALLWNFLGVCIAANVNIKGNSLTGAGFVSLVLSLFLIVAAFVLIVLVRTRWSATPIVVVGTSSDMQLSPVSTVPQESNLIGKVPNLLGELPPAVKVVPKDGSHRDMHAGVDKAGEVC